jgi:hypothetical protein
MGTTEETWDVEVDVSAGFAMRVTVKPGEDPKEAARKHLEGLASVAKLLGEVEERWVRDEATIGWSIGGTDLVYAVEGQD